MDAIGPVGDQSTTIRVDRPLRSGIVAARWLVTKVRSVLCFGDSNTHGFLASTEGRLGRWERWTGVAQRALGVEDWYLIEDGLGGRTTTFEFPGSPGRNGQESLLRSLELHEPLDGLVIFLGTNDVCLPGVTAAWAAAGVEALIEDVRTRPDPDPRPEIPHPRRGSAAVPAVAGDGGRALAARGRGV